MAYLFFKENLKLVNFSGKKLKDNYITFLRLIAYPGGPLSSKTKAFKNEKPRELSSKSFQLVEV